MSERETRGKPGHASEQNGSTASRQELAQVVRAQIRSYFDSLPKEYRDHRIERGFWELPENVIRRKIWEQIIQTPPDGDISGSQRRSAFWTPIIDAWDAIVYERYQPGSTEEENAGHNLNSHFKLNKTNVLVISPDQTRMLDVLTEAAGLKREPGQQHVQIPDKLLKYEQYQQSAEYRTLIQQSAPQGHRWKKR